MTNWRERHITSAATVIYTSVISKIALMAWDACDIQRKLRIDVPYDRLSTYVGWAWLIIMSLPLVAVLGVGLLGAIFIDLIVIIVTVFLEMSWSD